MSFIPGATALKIALKLATYGGISELLSFLQVIVKSIADPCHFLRGSGLCFILVSYRSSKNLNLDPNPVQDTDQSFS